jgi:dienelactone hydrolase
MGALLACGLGQAAQRPQAPSRAQACVPDAGIVNWTPDVLHPVSYGFKDYSADQAPMPLRVFYPSHQPFTEGGAGSRPLLKLCTARWPVVLFLHGRPPCEAADPNYFRRWTRIPAVLAKSGYVVAVPGRAATFPDPQTDPAIAQALSVIDWVRGVGPVLQQLRSAKARVGGLFGRSWEGADWVDQSSTAIVGHSWGALLAARVAQARPSISSYVGLSGTFAEFSAPGAVLRAIPCPRFFLWADDVTFEDLDNGGMWSAVPQPKHAAIFQGEHFDYLPSTSGCSAPRGPCDLIEPVAADLAALFIARNTPVRGSAASIPVSLAPPAVSLSPNQQFFGANNLRGLRDFFLASTVSSRTGCRMTLRWETPDGSGARSLRRRQRGHLRG